jgi:hypothetical protein
LLNYSKKMRTNFGTWQLITAFIGPYPMFWNISSAAHAVFLESHESTAQYEYMVTRNYAIINAARLHPSPCSILHYKNRYKCQWQYKDEGITKLKLNPVALFRERTIPTELQPLVDEVSANFCGWGCHVISVTDPYGRILGFLDRSRYHSFQVAPQLYSRGWVDPPKVYTSYKNVEGTAGKR